MSDLSGPEVRGLRAAARLTGRSPSGLQKLIDAGRLAARKDDENAYVFAAADLAAVRRDSSASAGTAGEMTPDHAAVDDEPDLQGLRPAALLDVVPVAGAERFDEGTTAATVFASLNANRTLVEIVVDHMLVFGATGSIERTARFLRHRSTKVTSEFYLHIDAEELRREISQIDLWRTR